MISLLLLKEFIKAKLKLGIKGKEQLKRFELFKYELGDAESAYNRLVSDIVDSRENEINELYEQLCHNRNLTKEVEIGIHQTLGKLLADFNIKQIKFLITKDKAINILSGSVRSGKTWIACFKFGLRVMNSPKDAKFMMVGTTLKSLESNCFKYFKLFFGDSFSYSLSNKSAKIFGHEIRLEGAPNERAVDKITGDTLAGAFIDEIHLIPKNFVLQVWARCSDGDGFIYGTCNPRHPSFWLYKEWITNPEMADVVVCWTFIVSDNIFLPESYIKSLSILFTGVFYERNVLGRWVAAEGSVFSLFANNHKKYIVQDTPELIEKLNKELAFVCVGLDFGGNKSGSTLVFTGFYKEIKDGVVVLKSAKLKDKKGEIDAVRLNNWVITNIKEFQKRFKVPIFNLNGDNAEQYLLSGVRNELRKNGLRMVVEDALKMRIMERVQFVLKMMALEKMVILSSAVELIQSLDELVYNEKSTKDELLDDGTTDNDTWDAFSYSFEKHINRFNYL